MTFTPIKQWEFISENMDKLFILILYAGAAYVLKSQIFH